MASLAGMQGDLDPRHAKVKEQYTGALLSALKAKEAKMDEEMSKLETMNEDDFEVLREKRKAAMQKAAGVRQKNLLNGHGRYMELSDQQEFFNASKNSKLIVVHFYRPATWRCQVVDRHFGELAPQHLETRFCKIDAEKSPFLVERLQIVTLPTILCIKDGKTVHQIVGFDEFGGLDAFPGSTMEFVLASHSVLSYDGPPPDDVDEDTGVNLKGPNSTDMRRSAIREGASERQAAESDDEVDAYLEGFEEPTADESG